MGPCAHGRCCICRFQLSSTFARLTPQQNIMYAQTVQKAALAKYIAGGGLPPLVGESALAGGAKPGSPYEA